MNDQHPTSGRDEPGVETLKAALGGVPVPLALVDRHGHLAFVNQAWTAVDCQAAPFGPHLAAHGEAYRSLLHRQQAGKAAAIVATAVDRVLEGHIDHARAAYSVEKAEGPHAYQVVVERLRGAHAGWVCIRHEPAPAGATRPVDGSRHGELLAGLGDELRGPLDEVIGKVDLALDTSLTTEQTALLNGARRAASALSTVINDLLDFSKLEAGRLQLEHIPFQLRDSLMETLEPLAELAHDKGLELLYDVVPDVPRTVEGDPTRLRQVIATLVTNAIEFTERGQISLRVERDPVAGERGLLRFEVSDTGVGVPQIEQSRMFQALGVAGGEGALSRPGHGAGLDLVIANELARMMGQPIAIDSQPGRGCRFRFAADLPACGGGSGLQLVPAEVLRGLRVLVADDHEINRRAVRQALEPHGVEVTACEDGLQAWARLARSAKDGQPLDLALLDVRMPGIDGFSLAAKLRQEQALATVPVIVLTLVGQRGDAARCREARIDGYLAKPFTGLQLLQAVQAVLGQAAKHVPRQDPAPLVTRHSLREQRKRWHVLVVEDNEVNRRLARAILEKQGHTVHLVHDGKQAVEAVRQQSFDLVLMDIQMPVMDGIEATRRIREMEQGSGRRLPIIAQTAHAMAADRHRFMAEGMDGYISKPFELPELLDAIDRLASRGDEPASSRVFAAEEIDSRGAIVDRRALAEQTGCDPRLLNEIIDLYLADRQSMIDALARAIDAADATALRMEAHKLKGTFRVLAADPAAEVAHRMESMARDGVLDGAPALLELIVDGAERVEQELLRIRRAGVAAGD